MEHKVFVKLFEYMKDKKEMDFGGYTLKYELKPPRIPMGVDLETIYYTKGRYTIGSDAMLEWYELGDIMPTKRDTYEDGIKNYKSLLSYLDALYESNIEEAKKEVREREHEQMIKKREQLSEELEEERVERKFKEFLRGGN